MFLIRMCLFWLFLQPALAVQTVDINSADAAQLASALTGVGEKKAQLIVAWRQEHGPFKSLDDLAKVKGFGSKLIERNQDRIVFSASSDKGRGDRGNNDKGVSSQRTLNWPGNAYVTP